MIISILKNAGIIICLFFVSISVSFTILSWDVKIPDTVKYRLFQEQQNLKSLEKTLKSVQFDHDSLKRELKFKKSDLQQNLILTDSLLNYIEKLDMRMSLNEKKIKIYKQEIRKKLN